VIGRGKAAGLAIKDPNISREHAVVEQEGGRYFLVDQRSTNGTLVNGQRITRREIADGDVAIICEHQVRFSFTRLRG
jgi:pSer/pThr/pTyr-binding forkhead associated (FHA) protein